MPFSRQWVASPGFQNYSHLLWKFIVNAFAVIGAIATALQVAGYFLAPQLPTIKASFCTKRHGQNEFSFWQSLVNHQGEVVYLDLVFHQVLCPAWDKGRNEYPYNYPEIPPAAKEGNIIALTDNNNIRMHLNSNYVFKQYNELKDKYRFRNASDVGPDKAAVIQISASGEEPLAYVRGELDKYAKGAFHVTYTPDASGIVVQLRPASYTDGLQRQVDCITRLNSRFWRRLYCPFL